MEILLAGVPLAAVAAVAACCGVPALALGLWAWLRRRGRPVTPSECCAVEEKVTSAASADWPDEVPERSESRAGRYG